MLDPFAGSGTTLAVAKKLGRRFLGFELSAEYAEQIKQRLEQIQPGDPLEGAAEPLVSAPSHGRRAAARETRSGAANASKRRTQREPRDSSRLESGHP